LVRILSDSLASTARRRRSRIVDIARVADVSVSTVDRVLNGRTAVTRKTAERVVEAARELGYHATHQLDRRIAAVRPAVRLGFLLQKAAKPSYQDFAEQIAATVKNNPAVRGDSIVAFVDEISPQAILRKLDEIALSAAGAAIVAIDHPLINERIDELRAEGFPVVAMLSDISTPQRAGYAGVDNRKVGRTAAWTISRLSKSPGKVGIMVGSHRYLGQEDRDSGFRSFFRETAAAFEILEPRLYLDDPAIAYEAAAELLTRHGDLVGLYSAGGGINGTLRAVRESRPEENFVFVCQELTPPTRDGLLTGAIDVVINQPRRQIAEKAIEILLAAIDNRNHEPVSAVLPFEIFISENI
jgi:LacI family transcriptional regulator, galactose operon repressor